MAALFSGIARSACGVALLGLFAMPALAQPTACPAQPPQAALSVPRAAATFARTKAITIVAIGSSSTTGVGASDPSRTYPAVLEAELQARFPGTQIRVVNKGGNGEDVPENLTRFDRDVGALKPDVVLWQVGTNYVLRSFGLGNFGAQLRTGIGAIRAYGADPVLIDLQYSPWVNIDADTGPMLKLIAEVGQQENVPVIARYAMMKRWKESDGISMSQMIILDGLHLTDWSYKCFAQAVAARLASGLAQAPRPAKPNAGAPSEPSAPAMR
ncbi:SGNH/GDSL hydrolase family protein [Roseixanthobacter glucoisosaccharinicivorans]|uniref:SGNH/GDSL hydrolase family protein n=1 Tax=Roseixanthobacter glucoisosaccharinicivorans TaxID=3119923 RepID=UPI0037264F6B